MTSAVVILAVVFLLFLAWLLLKPNRTKEINFRSLVFADLHAAGNVINDDNVDNAAALTFFGEILPFGISMDAKAPGLTVDPEYCGDIALFEISCMFLGRADQFLLQHASERVRQHIGRALTKKLLIYGAKSLRLTFTDISALISYRLNLYETLHEKSADLPSFHLYVKQLILAGVKAGHPVNEVGPPVIDLWADHSLTMALLALEKHSMTRQTKQLWDWIEVTS